MPCLEGRWWVWRETWCRRRDGCGPRDRNLALCHHLSPHQVPVGADSYHTILDGCEKAGQASHHGSEQSFCLGWPGVTAASHPGQQRTPSAFLRETLHPPCCLARGPQCRDETATNRVLSGVSPSQSQRPPLFFLERRRTLQPPNKNISPNPTTRTGASYVGGKRESPALGHPCPAAGTGVRLRAPGTDPRPAWPPLVRPAVDVRTGRGRWLQMAGKKQGLAR